MPHSNVELRVRLRARRLRKKRMLGDKANIEEAVRPLLKRLGVTPPLAPPHKGEGN
jgi:hypothetical protein